MKHYKNKDGSVDFYLEGKVVTIPQDVMKEFLDSISTVEFVEGKGIVSVLTPEEDEALTIQAEVERGQRCSYCNEWLPEDKICNNCDGGYNENKGV